MIRRIASLALLAGLAACSADSTIMPSSNSTTSTTTTSLVLDSLSMSVGDTVAPVVMVMIDSTTRQALASEISLASSDVTVLTVTSSGKIAAIGSGRATITAVWKAKSSVAASRTFTVAAASISGGDQGYVQIHWVGNTPTAAVAAAFEAARVRINGLFNSFNGVVSVNPNIAASTCLDGSPAVNESVRGIVIFAQVTAIDGAGSILGSAGPCILRNGSFLPIVASMKFDSVDMSSMVATGMLNGVVLHEMMHTLGFGTIWTPDFQGEVALPTGADPRYLGTNAQAGFVTIGGVSTTGIPVENTGGEGTQGAHWRETSFGSELMTGWADGSMKMSRATVGALKDFGYDVDMSKADAFTLGSSLRTSALVASERIIETTIAPIGVVSGNGTIVPYRGRVGN